MNTNLHLHKSFVSQTQSKRKWSVFILILLAVLSSTVVNAANITSATTGNWSSPSTWVGGVVPTATDDVVIASGTTVTVTANTSVNTLTISGALVVNSSKTLTINGDINVSTGTLTVQDNAILTVYGNVNIANGANFNAGLGNSDSATILVYGNFTNNGTANFWKSVVVIGGNLTTASSILQNNGNIIVGGNISGVINGSGTGTVYPVNSNSTTSVTGNATIEPVGTIPTDSTLRDLMNQVIYGSKTCSISITDPLNVSTGIGCNATFTATAPSGSTFQWQLNTGSGWANTGTTNTGTSSTLTLTNVTIGMSGYEYRAQITLAGCTKNGDFAYLAINSVSSASSSPTLCINTPLTNITHTTIGTTGISNDGVSGGNGLPAGVSAHWSAGKITISGTPTTSGVFNYSIALTASCGSVTATGTITVNPAASLGSLLGTSVCIGSTTIFTVNSVVLGGGTGTWSSSDSTKATVDSGGLVTGVAVGSSNIIYTITGGCGGTATSTMPITVNALPVNKTVAAAASSVCYNTGTNITVTSTSSTVTYQLRNNSNNALVGTAVAGGGTINLPTGSITVATTYNVLATQGGCTQQMSITPTVGIIALPPSAITGGAVSVCVNSTTPAFADPTLGGAWTVSSGTGTASITTGGVVTALTAGTVTVVYTVTSGGCTNTATEAITVNAAPSQPTLGSIIQPTCSVATGSINLSGLPSAGTWTLTRTGTAGASTGGTGTTATASGLAAGTYNFTVTNASGCISTTLASVQITPLATATWTGGGWVNGLVPTVDTSIVLNGDYTIASNLSGCTCQIMSGNIVVNSGQTLTLTNGLNITGGTLTLQNNANLIQVNNVANTGSISVIRNSDVLVLYDYTYWSSPTSGSQTLLSFAPDSNPKYFMTYENKWTYLNSTVTTFNTGTTNVVNPGVGVAILAPTGITTNPALAVSKTYTFTGTPNNGDINVPVTYLNSTSRKLIGNPYPSALDADKFILANTGAGGTLTGTLYFWTHNTALSNGSYAAADYAVYNLTGGVGTGTLTENSTTNPFRWIASGQGFMAGTKATGTIVFNNSMRTVASGYSNSNFFKPASETAVSTGLEKNRIWLNLTDVNSKSSQTLIGYIETATNNYDQGFDGAFSSSSATAIYSLIANDTYIIQARTLPFVDSDIVPIGYKTDVNGDLTISIDSVDGLFLSNQNIYLEDKLLGVIHDLKSSSYTFTTVAGVFNNRFVLRYTNDTPVLNVGVFENSKDSVTIYSKNHQLTVKSNEELIQQILIYDLLGRRVYQGSSINSNETIISNLTEEQVLFVKVVLANNYVVTKKVIN